MGNILYGIQCTGNGHITRSKEIIRKLIKNGNSVDVYLSGDFSQVDTDDLNVIGKSKGLGFDVTEGGISFTKSIKHLRLIGLTKDIFSLDLTKYDTIVSDFEPVTCWSGILRGVNVLGVGNHYKFVSNQKFLKNLNPNFFINKLLVKTVCPVSDVIAFDYLKEGPDDFFPIIREHIRKINLSPENYHVVYLSGYSLEEQIQVFKSFPDEEFYIFHNTITTPTDMDNLHLRPIDKLKFTEKLIKSRGVICHTGFQTTSECLYLGKRLFTIPIKRQIEQIYNSKILMKMGVPVSENLNIEKLSDFFNNDYSVRLNYIDETDTICERIEKYNSKK
jgi:uncharacterized protein (TIGR00661 family)